MNSKHVFSTCFVIGLALSVYFTAGAAGQSLPTSYLPLTIYRLGSDGNPTPTLSNVFSSGDSIWFRVPDKAKDPLLLEAYKSSGTTIWNQQASVPPSRLLNLLLAPALFAPTSSYSIILRAPQENAPGLTVMQAYRADFLVTPAAATLSVEELARNNGLVKAIVTLLDRDRNPKVSVRIGLFLREGESSLPITTETTDARGRAAFQYGEALIPGSYTIEGQVLDNNAISARPLEISRFTIEKPQTQIVAWETPDGLPGAVMRELGSPKPLAGRLLLLEQQLQDGNWTVTQSSYTDVEGKVAFSKSSISGHWRVTFKGDTFYASSSSDSPTSSAESPALSPATGNVGLISPDIPMPCGPSPGPGFSLDSSVIQPECGGGGGSSTTVTILYLPPSAYATISLVLKARVTYSFGGAVTGVSVNFYGDGTLINSGITNSTGYASLLWTPGLTGSHTIKAEFPGNSYALSSFDQKSLTIGQTPTAIMMLKPQPIAFSWDLTRPIVVPIVTLELALAGSGSPAKIYMPSYNGSSTTPPVVPGFGWRGLNQTLVTVIFNSTYTQQRMMNWTRNFYLPPCTAGASSSCSTTPRTGHMYLNASISPPSTLYSASSTTLNIPYQNVNSLSSAPLQLPLTLDGSAQGFCSNTTSSCSTTLTTTRPNDIIIAFAFEALDLQTSCTFSISDTAGLSWQTRSGVAFGRYQGGRYRDQLQEFWARSPGVLSSVTITESISGCGNNYNGLQVFAISGANFDSPFDPASGLPASASGYGTGTSVTLSTSNPNVFVFAAVQHGSPPVPTPQPGFTIITSTGGWSAATEYKVVDSVLTNFAVTFGDTATDYWEEIADAVQAGNTLTQSATPPSHLYVNVNASYPYLSEKMQDIPVSLALYTIDLAYTLGSATAPGGTTTFILLPNPSDLAYVTNCQNSSCSVSNPSTNTQLGLWKMIKNKLTLCGNVYTNSRGVAHLNLPGPTSSCTYPYGYASITNTSTLPMIVEVFRDEAVSTPSVNPFFTNFQGYNYAIYAPQRTGRYMLHMHTYLTNAPYTILYPTTAYPDVKWPSLSCCDIFLNVARHPVRVDASITPGIATVLDKVNATIQLTDLATNKPMASSAFNYTLTRIDPGPSTITTGTYTTNVNGTSTLPLGLLSYGNYTLTISRSATATINPVNYLFNFTAYKARPTLIISPGWIQNAIAGQTYSFRTSLVNNATQTLIAVAGLTEQVYINDVLYGTFTTNSGGNATFSWTPATAGQYKIEVRFLRQAYYTTTSVTIMVSVARRNVVLAVDNSPSDPDVGQQVSWNVTAHDMINDLPLKNLQITQYIDGVSIATAYTNSLGYAILTYSFSSRGPRNVTFVSATNATYNSGSASRPLTAFLKTTLTLEAGTITLGQQNNVKVTLKDPAGTPLSGKLIRIEINGAFYQNVTTDSSGQAQFTWRPDNLGSFSIIARFSPTSSADLGYRASSDSLTVNVVPQTTTNTDSGTSGTQSVQFPSGLGQAVQTTGFKVSAEFPSLGTVVVKINYNGQLFQGSLHVWNEFGARCTTWVFGVCVFAVPYWYVHFDGTFNTAFFQLVMDFFTGAVTYQNAGGPFASVDPHSQPFGYGATAVDASLAAASVTFFAVLFLSSGAGEPAVGPAATAVMLAFALGLGLAGFLAYQDKQSRLNMLGGMLAEFGIGMVRYFVRIAGISVSIPYPCCNQLIPGLGAAWIVFWGIVTGSTPWTRVVLLTGLLTFFLAVLQVFLMIAFFT